MEKRSKKNASLHRLVAKDNAKATFSLANTFSYPDNYLKLRVLKNKEIYAQIDQRINLINQTKTDNNFINTYSVLSKIDQNYFGNKEAKVENAERKASKKSNFFVLLGIIFVLFLLIIVLAVMINGK